MPEPPAEHTTNLRCPRCNYDVSGPVPTWTTACPTIGTCPECGLSFDWRDVFHPLRDVPSWFFELVPKRRLRNALSTSLRTLLPWRFWRTIKLSFPVRYTRLFILLFAIALVWQTATPLFYASERFVSLTYLRPRGYSASNVLGFIVDDWRGFAVWPVGYVHDFDRVLSAWLLTGAIIPFCFLTAIETLGKARVRSAHLIRATAYSTLALIVTWLAWNAIQLGALLEARHDPFGWHEKYWKHRGLDAWSTAIVNAWVSWPFYYPFFMLLTWWCVCRFYLRIKHAFLTALLLLLMALLLTPIVGYPLGFFTDLINWLT